VLAVYRLNRCYEKLGQFARAVTLLRAALSAQLPNEYRARVEQQLARCLARAHKELSRASTRRTRKQSSAVP
jgi:hypothetical protein